MAIKLSHFLWPRAVAVCAQVFVVSLVQAQFSGQAIPMFEMPAPIENATDIALKAAEFTFVRIKYSAGDPSINTWMVDYPDADRNFSGQIGQLTGLATDPDGQILELIDPTLGQYPFIYIVEGGSLRLRDAEAAALRSYLLGGGFLMVDDFWGDGDWAQLGAQFRKVFPEYELVELSSDHEIFRNFYYFSDKPQVPSRNAVMSDDGQGESAEVSSYFGLIAENGRLMAIFCHNADLADGWENLQRPDFPKEISFGRAVPLGINIVVYALTH